MGSALRDLNIESITYGEPHEAHRAWIESVSSLKKLPAPEGNNRISKVAKYVKDSLTFDNPDVIVCEGGFTVRTAILYKIRHPKTKIIRLACSEEYYEAYNIGNDLEQRTHRILDGAIANSEFIKTYAEEYCNKVEVVNPFVKDLEKLKSIDPSFENSNKIVFIANNREVKQADLLAEAVSKTSYELEIYGKGHREYEYNNVHQKGFVKRSKLLDAIKNADMCIHPAIGESFGLSPVECMMAGTPALVSSKTGCKAFVPKKWVFEPEVESIRNKIEEFYQLSIEEREKLAKAERRKALEADLDRKSSVRNFKLALDNLIS